MASRGPGEKPAQKPAMRGDLTEGPIMRTLLLFSVPTLASNILQSLSGTVNSIWVGRLIGEDALAATANANIIMFLDGARRTFGSAVGFATLVMIAIAIVGWLAAPALLDLLQTPGNAYGLALTYIRLMFVSLPFMMVSVILTMGLRGTGDARTPLIFMGVTVAIDTVFNPMLISGFGPFPRLGIAG